MLELASKVEQTLQTYESSHARDLLTSATWNQVRNGIKKLTVELEVKGKHLSATRVDREYTQLADALRQAVTQENPPKIKDDFVLWDISQEFLCTLRGLSHFQTEINGHHPATDLKFTDSVQNSMQIDTTPIAEAISTSIEKLGQVFQPSAPISKPKQKSTSPSKSNAVDKRSWTSGELNEAIREYRAQRASIIQQFTSVLENPNATPSQKNRIRQNARKLFGRNAIARALGVKSPRMVGESSAWKALAGILELPRKKDDPTRRRSQQADHTNTPDIPATPRSAQKPYEADDSSIPADVLDMQQERKQTLKSIRKLATSGGDGTREHAESLLDAYDRGEMTDEQVRQTVDMLLEGI